MPFVKQTMIMVRPVQNLVQWLILTNCLEDGGPQISVCWRWSTFSHTACFCEACIMLFMFNALFLCNNFPLDKFRSHSLPRNMRRPRSRTRVENYYSEVEYQVSRSFTRDSDCILSILPSDSIRGSQKKQHLFYTILLLCRVTLVIWITPLHLR